MGCINKIHIYLHMLAFIWLVCVSRLEIICRLLFHLGLSRAFSGPLGSPNPFLIGWVWVTIKSCGGLGNGTCKSLKNPSGFMYASRVVNEFTNSIGSVGLDGM